jgi:hypothetical protein
MGTLLGYTRIHTYIYPPMHAGRHKWIHSWMHARMHTWIRTIHTCMQTFIHACMYGKTGALL